MEKTDEMMDAIKYSVALFNDIKSRTYVKAGDDVDYDIDLNHEEKMITLYFEETTTKRDWRNNFRFGAKVYKNQQSCIRAHRGYANAYKTVNDRIMNEMKLAMERFPDYHITITGWSYGGAMAVLAAEDFFFRFKKVPFLMTFGAPKVIFGRKAAAYINSVTTCVQFKQWNDLVTYLPPFPGYCHIHKGRIGESFNIIELCKPEIHHCEYGDISIYGC